MAYRTVAGVRLYYEWTPRDPERTVVFLNGVMTTTSSWELYVPLWKEGGWGVLLHDFRGQLQSDKPPGPYAFRRHVDDLMTLLDSLGIGAVHLVGTSYGGEVALHVAVEHPTRVRSLAVIDSASEIDALLDAFIRSWILLCRRETAREFYWSAIPSLYSRGFLHTNRSFLEERAEAFAALPEDYFAGQRSLYETFLSLDLTARLSAITSPTLVVCGEEDLLKPPRFSRLIAGRVLRSELVLLPRCGHVAIFEQPEALKSLLFGFTTKHAP
jgi:3-oxoadipate enol-lactonase